VPQGSVIGAIDPELILLIPALGPNFSYVPSGLRSLTPTGEIVRRFYDLALFLGLSEQDVRNLAAVRAHLHASALLFALGYDGSGESFADGYRRYRQGPHTARTASHHRLDYVIVEADRQLPADIPRAAAVVHANGRYRLLEMGSP
jgi:hypothetical protein